MKDDFESRENTNGIAIPLVSIINKKFVVSKEAIELFSQDKKAVGIISLVGKYRTGKSFLLNRVLLNKNITSTSFGFSVGPTVKPCTKGIWMWSIPMKINNNHYGEDFNVYFIDTEGLGAYDEEVNHDSKIFLIAVLISSLFLLNSFSSIDENSINNLSLILNLTKSIKLNKDDDKTNPEDLVKFFPSLLWLLRDFSLKLEDTEGNTITSKQYLENALSIVKGQSSIIEEKNKVRKMITLCFQERDCYTMIRPVESEEHLQNLSSLPDKYFRSEFLSQCETLRNKIYKKIKPKVFNGKVMTGKMIINILCSIIESLNQGSIPVIESTWNYVVNAEGTKYFEELLKEYSEKLSIFYNKIKMLDSANMVNYDFNNELLNYNKNIQSTLIEKFEKFMKGIDDNSNTEIIEKFKAKLNILYIEINENNQKLFREKFGEIINSQYKLIENKIKEKSYFSLDNIFKLSTEIPNNINYKVLINGSINYHQFFQDIDNIKELLENSTPFFNGKSEEMHQKQMQIIKYFIEETFIKEKGMRDTEILKIVSENQSSLKKMTTLNNDLEDLKSENKNEKDKFQYEILELKSELRGNSEIISNLEKEKKKLIDNNNFHQNKISQEFLEDREKLEKKNRNLEEEIKYRDNQILTMKFNEEKLIALNKQKNEFLENEINSLKEKIKNLVVLCDEQKTNNENLNEKISEQSLIRNNNNSNLDIVKEKQSQIDFYKIQLEETKKIYEDIIGNLKDNRVKIDKIRENDVEVDINNGATIKEEYKEIIESNKVNIYLNI